MTTNQPDVTVPMISKQNSSSSPSQSRSKLKTFLLLLFALVMVTAMTALIFMIVSVVALLHETDSRDIVVPLSAKTVSDESKTFRDLIEIIDDLLEDVEERKPNNEFQHGISVDRGAYKYMCDSLSCLESSRDFLSSVDARVNPCDNFNDYICGDWLKRHKSDGSSTASYLFTDLEDQFEEDSLNLLGPSVSSNDSVGEPVVVQKLKDLFGSCVDLNDNEQTGIDQLNELFTAHHGLPLLGNWQEADWSMEDMLVLGHDKLFVVEVDRYGNIPLISLSRSPAKWATFYSDWDHLVRCLVGVVARMNNDRTLSEHYDTWRQTGVCDHEPASVCGLLHSMAADVKTLYEELAILFTDAASTTKDFEIQKFGEISDIFPEYSIDWESYFLKFFGEQVDMNRPIFVTVRNFEYFVKLFSLLQNRSKSVNANYLGFITISELYWETNVMLLFRFPDINVSDVAMTRRSDCLQYAIDALPLPFYHVFSQRYVTPALRNSVSAILANLKTTLMEELSDRAILNPKAATFGDISQKLTDLSLDIFGDALLDDETLDHYHFSLDIVPGRHFTNIFAVERFHRVSLLYHLNGTYVRNLPLHDLLSSYYNYMDKSLHLSLTEILIPNFDPGFPTALQYGGVGFTLAHELGHAILDQNFPSKNKNGLLEKIADWLGSLDYVGNTVNGKLTLEESTVDLFALHLSYRAYLRANHRELTSAELIPLLENIMGKPTPSKLFFAKFARSFCQYDNVLAAKSRVQRRHLPGQLRINGLLSITDIFGIIFECAKSSNMSSSLMEPKISFDDLLSLL